MIAVDTNILVHAHRFESPDHEAARGAVEALASGSGSWALPWPVAHEFVCVMTGPSPTAAPLDMTLAAIERLLETRGCVPLAEGRAHWPRATSLARRGGTAGPRFYDARIAAICLDNGVRELWTADRDFGRFPELRTRNPLVG